MFFFFLFRLCYDHIYDWICFTDFKHLPDDFTMHLLFWLFFFWNIASMPRDDLLI